MTNRQKNDMIIRAARQEKPAALFLFFEKAFEGSVRQPCQKEEPGGFYFCGNGKEVLFTPMDDGYSPASLLLLVGFILLEAVFYGFGSAIQNVNEGKLEEDAQKGDVRAERLLKVVNRPARFVNTIQLTTHLIGILTGAVILPLQIGAVARQFQSLFDWGNAPVWYLNPGWWRYAALTVAVGLALLILMISFGIVIPKRLAARNPERWGYRMLTPVLWTACFLLPVTRTIGFVSWAVLRLFGVDITADSDSVTEEDIMSMVNEGREQGVIEAGESKMITNIFQLGNKEAQDIMTHRTSMVLIDGASTLREAVDYILNQGNKTRYPVYGEDIDDIIGILHLREAMTCFETPKNRDRLVKEIPGLLQEVSFIPETRPIDSLFKEMQSRKIHMEIVVDEYGQTAGLLTMEDILEEIVGNIQDEYDEDEEFILAQPDQSYVMKGKAELEDVAETLGLSLTEEDLDTYGTLNGLLVARLDRIPGENERPVVEYGGWRFEVLEVKSKTIETVRVTRLLEEEQAGEKETQGGCE